MSALLEESLTAELLLSTAWACCTEDVAGAAATVADGWLTAVVLLDSCNFSGLLLLIAWAAVAVVVVVADAATVPPTTVAVVVDDPAPAAAAAAAPDATAPDNSSGAMELPMSVEKQSINLVKFWSKCNFICTLLLYSLRGQWDGYR